MILTIDAGNTNVCCAIFDQDILRHTWRASTHLYKTADEWSVWLVNILSLQGIGRQEIEAVVISSVVPEALENLKKACREYFIDRILVIGDKSIDIGIKALIDYPEEAGADLLVNAVAAHHFYKGPLLIIDFGTATTVSLIDEKGNFCGVSIAPGINLSLSALSKAAAKLPDIHFAKPKRVVGTNTIDSMQSGVFWGYISMIEGLVHRIKQEQKERFSSLTSDLKVIATGGLSPLIAKEANMINFHDPDLTLKGLNIIYKTWCQS